MKTNRFFCFAITAIAFVFAFIHTACREWVGDDVCYAAVFSTEDSGHVELIENVRDIFRSQFHHYKLDNGRFPVHFAVQFFVGITGKIFFAICNAAVFVLFLLLICRVISGRFSFKNPWLFFLVTICLFTFFPTASEVRMGPWFGAAMALNYLWTATAFLLFYLIWQSKRQFNNLQIAGILILSFLLGWSNEAFSIPLTGAILIGWKGMTKVQRMMSVSLAIGAMLLVVAPGTIQRGMAHGGGKSIKDIAISLIDCYSGIKLFWLFIIAIIVGTVARKKYIIVFFKENKLLATTLLIAILFSLFAHSEAHSLTFIELISLLLLGRLLLCLNIPAPRVFLLWPLLILFIGFECALIVENSHRRAMYIDAVERYKKSSDGFTYIESPQSMLLIDSYTDNYFHPVTPRSYYSTRFATLYGRPGVLPLILNATDYNAIIEGTGPLIDGSAKAIEGADWYIVPYKSKGEFIAFFDDESFMDDFSLIRKAIYKILLKSRKAPKKLEAEHIRANDGEYFLLRKLLSRPTRIEFIEVPELQ